MGQVLRDIDAFFARFLSPAVRWIFLANVLVFILYMLLTPFSENLRTLFFLLMQTPALAVKHFFIWQFTTYMFMHADTMHLLCNMIVLWFFASRLEYRWGTRGFLKFYFTVGIGAGLFHAAVALLNGQGDSTMLGASGAIYGIMLAYALYYPNDTVLLYFVVPVKIKYLMIFLGVITFLGSIHSAQGGVSHVTHLGGLVVAFLYVKGGSLLGGGGAGPGKRRRKPRRRRRILQVDPNSHPDFR